MLAGLTQLPTFGEAAEVLGHEMGPTATRPSPPGCSASPDPTDKCLKMARQSDFT